MAFCSATKRVATACSQALASAFAGDSKTAAESYVHAISDAMAENIVALPWMDAQTKAKADAKRKAMSYQIGYPNKWKTYDFKTDRKNFGANAIVRFDPRTLRFRRIRIPTADAAVRQQLGRRCEVWSAESAVDKLLVVRTC